MELSTYLTTFHEGLTATASAGDDHAQRVAAALAGALEPAARLALMNALSDFATEVTSQLDDHVIDVRLDGKDVRAVVTPAATHDSPGQSTASSPNEEPPQQSPVGGDISRMTLRLFEELKSKAEHAAASQGVSLNTYVSQAVQSAIQGGARKHAWWNNPAAGGTENTTHAPSWRDHTGDDQVHGWVQG